MLNPTYLDDMLLSLLLLFLLLAILSLSERKYSTTTTWARIT